jgi:hypothetical protein
MILLAVFLVAAAAIVAHVALSAWREHRTPAELRRDWWPQFEREFRAYARQLAGPVQSPDDERSGKGPVARRPARDQAREQ